MSEIDAFCLTIDSRWTYVTNVHNPHKFVRAFARAQFLHLFPHELPVSFNMLHCVDVYVCIFVYARWLWVYFSLCLYAFFPLQPNGDNMFYQKLWIPLRAATKISLLRLISQFACLLRVAFVITFFPLPYAYI